MDFKQTNKPRNVNGLMTTLCKPCIWYGPNEVFETKINRAAILCAVENVSSTVQSTKNLRHGLKSGHEE